MEILYISLELLDNNLPVTDILHYFLVYKKIQMDT